MPDSDTAILMSIASNTISMSTNTLKILEVAKETREKIEKYHWAVMRRFYLMQRLERYIRDLATASKLKPKTHRELNIMLARLKANILGIKDTMDDLLKSLGAKEEWLTDIWEKITESRSDLVDSQDLEKQALAGGTLAKTNQLTAVGVSQIGQLLSKKSLNDLSYQKLNIEYQRLALMQEAKRKMWLKNWLTGSEI